MNPSSGPQGMGGTTPATNPGAKPPGTGMKKAGLILLILGIIGFVIGVVVLVVSIIGVVGVAKKVADESTTFTGTTTLQLEAGKDMQAYKVQGESTPSCIIVGADGTEPETGTISASSSTPADGQQWESFGSFTAKTTQEYSITCDGDQEVMVAPPLSVGGILGGVGGIVASVFVGVVGFLLVVTGVVLLIVGRNRMKKAAAPGV
ncbi:hypothetical protein DEO23_06710 [Brachybacterium endophyticum]|uniref:Uncharacterized protein n=1 Tax=Brachybacterium endophyticum TaxID=2182385 RepID=A0A2U2RL85_9MICO|nr:hypothetical protein DEO23_06710 [Brachybacterium endophyticum]